MRGGCGHGPPLRLLSAAMSVDGYIDDAWPERLVLSGDADLDRVDAVRATVDAILVGPARSAATTRACSCAPRTRVGERVAAGARRTREGDDHPRRATSTPTRGSSPRATRRRSSTCRREWPPPERLGAVADVVDAGAPLDPRRVLADLAGRGVARLMVEGGTARAHAVPDRGPGDELHLVVAPFFVGDPAAPRFVGAGSFPHDARHRMRLAEVRAARRRGAAAVPAGRAPRGLRLVRTRCEARPIALSRRVLTAVADGVLGGRARRGRGRDGARRRHSRPGRTARRTTPRSPPSPPWAADGGHRRGTTLYSSLEPCSARASRPRTCTELILAAGIGRVVFAWREPAIFVEGRGAELLHAAGVEVVELPELASVQSARSTATCSRLRNRATGAGDPPSLPFIGC